jgi:hypothetical protein
MLTFSSGNAALVATAIGPSQTQNLAKVTFSNGQEAGVSISAEKFDRYWNLLPDGQWQPKFLSADNRIVPTFIVRNLSGTLMIIEASAGNRPIVL